MIPQWLFELMAKNRSGCVMELDEHGQPIDEEPLRLDKLPLNTYSGRLYDLQRKEGLPSDHYQERKI